MSDAKFTYLTLMLLMFGLMLSALIALVGACYLKLDEVEANLESLEVIRANRFDRGSGWFGRSSRLAFIHELMTSAKSRKQVPGADEAFLALPLSLKRWVHYPYVLSAAALVTLLIAQIWARFHSLLD